jgi:hypothetical protein
VGKLGFVSPAKELPFVLLLIVALRTTGKMPTVHDEATTSINITTANNQFLVKLNSSLSEYKYSN